MDRHTTNQYQPDSVSPPGDTLRDILEERHISQADLALRMGRPKKTISEIMSGKAPITHETALQLELVLGVSAEFWNMRETHYREFLARTDQEAELAAHRDWARNFPSKQMADLGFIPKVKEPEDEVRYLLRFFGVSSPAQWEEVNNKYEVAFRKSTSVQANPYALSAWLRAGQVEAETMRLGDYDVKAFKDCLTASRALTTENPETFLPALKTSCAAAGVGVAFVPQLPKSAVSGATRWLSPDQALIQLSLRYKTNDHLWFTFFHEAAHVLLHGKRQIFLENGASDDELEKEADRWAADFLIPRPAFDEMSHWSRYSTDNIVGMARELGIAPGIIVGRLQHEGRLPVTHLNKLKVRLRWSS